VLTAGEILLAGGKGTRRRAQQRRLLDRRPGGLSPAGTMGRRTFGHTATLLGNGKV
jgi:hypothetical protein